MGDVNGWFVMPSLDRDHPKDKIALKIAAKIAGVKGLLQNILTNHTMGNRLESPRPNANNKTKKSEIIRGFKITHLNIKSVVKNIDPQHAGHFCSIFSHLCGILLSADTTQKISGS